MKPPEFAPGPGHNSRASDIKRTAEEIFAKARAEWIRPDTSLTQRWQVELLCSNLPANAKLFGIVAKMHGDSDTGENIYPSLDRMQVLTSLSRNTAMKMRDELVKRGFLEFERKGRGRGLTDAFKLVFPEESEKGPATAPFHDAKRSNGCTFSVHGNEKKVQIEGVKGPTAATYLVLPCVEEEAKNTHRAREGCNGFSLQTESEGRGLQETQAPEAELFDAPAAIGPLPSKEHLQRWEEITRRWGRSPSENPPPRDKPDFKVGQWLKSDVKALGYGLKYEPEIINAALEATLSAMEACTMDEPTAASVKGAKPAKNYFGKQFPSDLARLRKIEHDARVDAKKVETLAEDEVISRRTANEKASAMKLGALDRSITLNEQKRIEDGNARAAGSPQPKHWRDQKREESRENAESSKRIYEKLKAEQAARNGRTITNEDGKRRYHPGFKLVTVYGQTTVFGEHANKLLLELEAKGASFDDVDDAFGTESGKAGDRTQTREEVLKSVRRAVQRVLDERRDKALRAKFGGPIQQLAESHMQHPDFLSDWVCISREKVAEIAAKCPDVKLFDGEWRCYHRRKSGGSEWGAEDLMAEKFLEIVRNKFFSHDDYGAGLQERVERELEELMLKEQAYGAKECEFREREEEEKRKEREAWAKEQAEWEATRPEREARRAAKEAKRADEEAQKHAALEADAENLSWDGQSLILTETGEQSLPVTDKSLLKDVLNTFSKQITNPLARRTGPLGRIELAQLWRDIKPRVERLHSFGFVESPL